MRGRFDVCNIFEPYKGQQQGIKKIDKLVDGLRPVPVHATYSRSISLKPLAIPQSIREQPLFKTRGLSTVYRVQQFHSMPSCCYREATPPSLDGSEPDKSSRSIHGFHIARICQTNTGFFVERAGRSFTVRPVTFWMDKLLEVEKSKRVSESSTPPPAEHTLVEKTVAEQFYLSLVNRIALVLFTSSIMQMADSYMEEYLPLKSSPELLDEYIFFDGRVRLGKILEGDYFFTQQFRTL